MNLPPDIITYIESTFSPEQRSIALELIESAVLENGELASPRCQRAALIGASGSIEKLKHYIALLKIDFRDVIISGEYEGHGNNLRQVRDLNEPLVSHL